MKIFFSILSFTIILFSMLSCSDYQTFNDITQVKNLEILGIQADKPDSYTNKLIKTKMLIAEPINYNKEYHKIWLLCDPQNHGETQTGLVACMSNDLNKYIEIISSDTDEFSFKINKTSLENYDLKAKYVYVIAGICEAKLDECKAKLENLTKDTLFGDNSIFKLAFKRIRIVSSDYAISNSNPSIEEVYLDENKINENITLSDKNKYRLKAIIDNNSYYGSVGNKEFMKISWKTNFGNFSKYETVQFYNDNNIESTDLTIDDNSKNVTNKKIYIIATNLRGGISWKVINVE